MKIKVVSVEKSPHSKCARCFKHRKSVTRIPLYPDLCSVCAYDIHHLIVTNADKFKKEGSL